MFRSPRNSVRAIALTLVGSVALTVAHAELVYDEEGAPASAKVEERDQMRKVYKATQQVEVASELAPAAAAVEASTAPVVVDSSATEAPVLSRSELLRRKRVREEMKNEDLLQQRLEELRLREEEKRTKKILKQAGLTDEEQEEASTKSMSPAPVVVQETTVAAPVTEAPATVTAQVQQPQVQPMVDRMGYSQSSASMMGASTVAAETSAPTSGEGRISVTPKFGFVSISNDYYDMTSKYAAGIGLAFGVSDHLSLELGYLYSQSAVRFGPQFSAWGYDPNRFQEIQFHQNIFDLGLKLHFTDSSSKVRPFVGAGVGYSMGYVKYDEMTRSRMRTYYGMWNANNVEDYELNQILGTLSAGLELQIAKKVSIGGGYKLMAPLSSSENDRLYNAWGYNGMGSNPEAVRGSLKESTSHLFYVSGTFSF